MSGRSVVVTGSGAPAAQVIVSIRRRNAVPAWHPTRLDGRDRLVV
jgi:hypothetical protein